MEVCKIRLQAQLNSMVDPGDHAARKYKNVFHAGTVIVREEGVGALYKGIVPTMIRQGSNQVREERGRRVFYALVVYVQRCMVWGGFMPPSCVCVCVCVQCCCTVCCAVL